MSAAILPLVSSQHAFLEHGLLAFYRDLADEMHKAAEADSPVQSVDVSTWVLKLDTLNNTLAESSDTFSDALRAAGSTAPLAWGSLVNREGT